MSMYVVTAAIILGPIALGVLFGILVSSHPSYEELKEWEVRDAVRDDFCQKGELSDAEAVRKNIRLLQEARERDAEIARAAFQARMSSHANGSGTQSRKSSDETATTVAFLAASS